MPKYNNSDLSELERELESDLSGESELETDEEFDNQAELETDGSGETETELEMAGDFELADDADLGGEIDSAAEGEYEELDGPASEYGERFFELSQREFESPGSMDAALHEVLQEMGREYFLRRAWRRLKKRAPGLKKLVNTGLKLARTAGLKIPALSALKNMSGLAQSILQGNLAGIGKNALAALVKAHPGAAAAMPVLSALGFENYEDPGEQRRAWDNFAEVAREAYENLADNLNETAYQPAQAAQLAASAVQQALQNSARKGAQRGAGLVRGRRRTRVVRLGPGERLLVIQRRPGP